MPRKRNLPLSATVPQEIIESIEEIWRDPKIKGDYNKATGKELSKSKVYAAALAVALKDKNAIIQMLRQNTS